MDISVDYSTHLAEMEKRRIDAAHQCNEQRIRRNIELNKKSLVRKILNTTFSSPASPMSWSERMYLRVLNRLFDFKCHRHFCSRKKNTKLYIKYTLLYFSAKVALPVLYKLALKTRKEGYIL